MAYIMILDSSFLILQWENFLNPLMVLVTVMASQQATDAGQRSFEVHFCLVVTLS